MEILIGMIIAFVYMLFCYITYKWGNPINPDFWDYFLVAAFFWILAPFIIIFEGWKAIHKE